MKKGRALPNENLFFLHSKEHHCNFCKYKGHFDRLCKSKAKKPTEMMLMKFIKIRIVNFPVKTTIEQ